MHRSKQLAICVPSRGRPATFTRFLESFYMHKTYGLSTVILRNGEADPSLREYDRFDTAPDLIRYIGRDSGFKTTLDGTAGYCVAQQDIWEAYPGFSAYLCMEDDCVLESPGFDKWLLDALDEFPNRVGMIELVDRANQVQCQCFSAEWCNALGFLCHPDVGEPAFKLATILAGDTYGKRGEGAQFTHRPLLGDTGTERSGSPKWKDGTTDRFYAQEAKMMSEWIPQHLDGLTHKLREAARKTYEL